MTPPIPADVLHRISRHLTGVTGREREIRLRLLCEQYRINPADVPEDLRGVAA